jgi:cytochrome P450
MWGYNTKATELITPIIKQREREEKLKGYEPPNDTLQWIRDVLPEGEKKDYFYQAVAQLTFGAAAIHTTSAMITNVIFNLAAYPEYIPLLRDEAQAVLDGCGGVWTIESMSKLKKMDSFMKESQRHGGAVARKYSHKA